MSDDDYNTIYDELGGESIDSDEWEVVSERPQGSEEPYEKWANRLIEQKTEFADYIDSNPSGFSYLDKSYYKIRFKYIKKSRRTQTPSGKPMSKKSRPFCENMMRRTGQGIVYRLEDIDKASREGVNKTLGHKGKPYDLFKWKGGVYCLHAWVEVLYRLKKSTVVKKGEDLPENIEDYKRVSDIPASYKTKPRGDKESKEAAKPSNNWWRYPK